MKKIRSLTGNTFLALIGNVSLQLGRWAFVIMTARLLGEIALGELALGLAITSSAFILAELRLRDVQAADAAGRFSFQDFLRLRLYLSFLAVIGCCAVGFCAYGPFTGAVIACTSIYKAIDSLGDITHGVFQKDENLKHVAWSHVFRGVISASCFVITALLFGDLKAALLVSALGSFLVFTHFDLPAVRRTLQHISPSRATARDDRARRWQLLRHSLPLGVTMFIGSLIINIPRYMVNGHLGPAELGIYAALGYQVVIGTQLVKSFGQSSIARLSRTCEQGDRSTFLRNAALGAIPICAMGTLLILGSWLCGEFFLRVTYGPLFATQWPVMVVLMIAGSLLYLYNYGTFALIAAGKVRHQLIVVCLAAVTTASVGWWTTFNYGIVGAAWSAVAGYAVACLGTVWSLVCVLPRRKDL